MNKNHFKKQIEERLNQKVIKLTPVREDTKSTLFVAQTKSKKYFVKTSYEPSASFQFEATGLKILSQHYPHIPTIYSFSQIDLIIEFIESEKQKDLFWMDLANQIALLHQTKKTDYGFYEDNHIGLSTQKNIASPDEKENWNLFFWNNRLQYKLDQLKEVRKFIIDADLEKKLKECVLKELSLFKSQPTLIHGDLWTGNIICGLGQKAYLIDPAVSFSDREADMAMTECFGGFSPLFYSTYQKILPLEEGYEKRKHIYNLYHMLNHFVIFGEDYKQSCLEITDLIIQS